MESKDAIKAIILVVLYGAVTPALAFCIKGRRGWQRLVFFVLCFMTISGLFVGLEWSYNLAYEEDYRGHARGYQFLFSLVPAGALVLASFLEAPRKFRWFPPGLILYLAHLALSFVSVVNAPVFRYVIMAALRSSQVTLILVAGYCFLKKTKDVGYFLSCFSVTMFWELFAVLKAKYVDGQYQVMGTFEHQNALSMFAIMVGLILLGAALGPKRKGSTLWLAGYLACAWIVECTLSRGGLVAFAIGTAGVLFFSLAERATVRRMAVATVLSVVAVLGVLLSLNTIIDRFNSPYNRDSHETRRLLNAASSEMVRDYPIGVGWNNFGILINPPYPYGDRIDDYFRSYGEQKGVDTNKGIVESMYYLLLAENGWQGLLSYVLLVLFYLWCNWRAYRTFRNHLLGSVSIGIAMGCIANYLQSFLERVLTQPRNLMLWMLVLALTARIEAWRRTTVNQRKGQIAGPVPQRRETLTERVLSKPHPL